MLFGEAVCHAGIRCFRAKRLCRLTRSIWSMASIGAGVSCFSLLIRWVIAAPTPESLNNGVALCRISDRWNYCLELMSESARVTVPSVF